MRARRFIVLAAASLLLLGTACELLVSHDLTAEPQATADAAQPDAAMETSVVSRPSCPYSTQPNLTASGDDGKTGKGTFAVLVVRTVSVTVPSGVDLDGICTCQFNGALNSCDPPAHDVPAGGPCDSDGGVDDRLADLFNQVPGGLAQHFLDQANHVAACGQQTILLGISDYNGLANDSQVEINVITSIGILDAPDAGVDAGVDMNNCTPHDGGTTYFLPTWDGTDRWAVAPNTTLGGFPLSVPINGLVRDYQLIADSRAVGQHLDVPVMINLIGTHDVRLKSPVVMARIRPTFADGGLVPLDEAGAPTARPDSFMVEGSMSGRANADELIRAAALAPFDTKGGPVLCTSPVYDSFKSQVCGYRDISFDPALDFVKGHTCDALSVTFQFTAYPGLIGSEHPVADVATDACSPDQLRCEEAGAAAAAP